MARAVVMRTCVPIGVTSSVLGKVIVLGTPVGGGKGEVVVESGVAASSAPGVGRSLPMFVSVMVIVGSVFVGLISGAGGTRVGGAVLVGGAVVGAAGFTIRSTLAVTSPLPLRAIRV